MKNGSMSTTTRSVEDTFEPFQKTIDQLWASFTPQARNSTESSTILVSGVETGCGATTVSCCAAIGLAQNLLVPTVIVETYMGSLSMARLFGLSLSPGLSEVLDGSVELADALGDSGIPNLRVLTFGYPRHGGVSAAAFHELFEELTAKFRYVILDAQPVLDSPATRVMLHDVDQAVLVIESNSTSQDNAAHAIETIEDANVDLVGTVLNKFKPEAPSWFLPSKWS